MILHHISDRPGRVDVNLQTRPAARPPITDPSFWAYAAASAFGFSTVIFLFYDGSFGNTVAFFLAIYWARVLSREVAP